MRFRVYKEASAITVFLFGMLLFGLILIISTLDAASDRQSALQFMYLDLFVMTVVLFGNKTSFAWIYIDAKGIKWNSLLRRPIFISWDECQEIGIWNIPRGYGLYHSALYFSKRPLTQQEILGRSLNQCKEHVWARHSLELLLEVKKYAREGTMRSRAFFE